MYEQIKYTFSVKVVYPKRGISLCVYVPVTIDLRLYFMFNVKKIKLFQQHLTLEMLKEFLVEMLPIPDPIDIENYA